MANIKEGYIPFKGLKTYYRIVGECKDGKKPLLTLHGGPGAQHDYLESLDGLAEYGRQVIYYDQLGCGKSPAPSNPDMWCEALFLEELDVVRDALGLNECHILGQSWGGMLGMLYTINQPKGVNSFIIASSPADISLWIKEALRLIREMPKEYAEPLLTAMETGKYEGEAYEKAFAEYYKRHVFTCDETPDYVARSLENSEDNEVYNTMQGKGEFEVTGKMKDFNVVDKLGKINVPTLVTSGLLDECTPLIAKQVYDGIPGAKWELFEYSGHLAHVEEMDKYNMVVEKFMEEHD